MRGLAHYRRKINVRILPPKDGKVLFYKLSLPPSLPLWVQEFPDELDEMFSYQLWQFK